VNLSEIRAEVREELSESSAEIWTDEEINDYINRAIVLIQRVAEWKESTSAMTLALGSNDPAGEPADISRIERITVEDNFIPHTTEFELNRYSDDWRNAANGLPRRWYYLYGQPTADMIRTYPPADVAKNMDIWYVTELSELVNDGDTPDLPAWVHPVSVYYALFSCYRREGPFQDFALASAYLREFTDWLEVVARIRRRQVPDRSFSLDGVTSGVEFESTLSRIEDVKI